MSREPHQDQKIEGSSIESSQVQLGQAEGDLTQVQGSNNWIVKFVFNPFWNQQSNHRQEYINRQVLLNKVRNFWIRGVLENSLYNKAQIELGLEEHLDAVDLVWETPEQPKRLLPKGVKAIDKFDELREGRSLLILGDPGSGKTTTLLELAYSLIERAENDVALPIPVVFNLSSWVDSRQKIADWLVQELSIKYQVSKSLGRSWVKEQKLLLLLDGLDEVKTRLRRFCIAGINQFSQEFGQTEIIVCSRIKDYKALSQRLRFQGAIFIQSLTHEQIDRYLDQAGLELVGVKIALQSDVILQELAKTPLMLSVMALAYQGKSAEELLQLNVIRKLRHLSLISLSIRREHLFNTYIEQMFNRRLSTQQFPKEKTIGWLIFLADRLSRESQTLFLIEQIQPNWLESGLQIKLYGFLSLLVLWLLASVLLGLELWIPSALSVLASPEVELSWINLLLLLLLHIFISVPMFIFFLILTLAPILLLLFAIPSFKGTLVSTYQRVVNSIQPVEKIQFSWLSIRNAYISYVESPFNILICTFFIVSSIVALFTSDPIFIIQSIFPGFLVFQIAILPFILVNSLRSSEVLNKSFPNQGIRLSLRSFIIISTAGGLMLGFIIALALLISGQKLVGLGFFIGFFLGWIFGVFGGGFVCIKHFSLRLIMSLNSYAPWNYAHFLDYATERIFLQKVGGGYIFIHRLLMEHFAQMGQNSQNS